MKYCEAIYQTRRWKTREVQVGPIGIGGDNPIRIQSMTTSDTRDVEATAAQIQRLADLGCDLVRVTVQGKKEAQSCAEIKNLLIKRGYTVPLVADIHFYPPAALFVADFVDKVRINPGNFVDKRASFKVLEYDDATYAQELEKIEEIFSPLVEKCKRLKKALRIGTNHGSLSDRIMNRYGDSPRGMVESALEFARICRKHDYHQFVFSMKASNPVVMMEAYRLLVATQMQLGWNYPLHLGVTEAGAGEDGRLKSAMGIGALLLDGLGDTIRVSLTEDPWEEIDPCRRLVAFAEQQIGRGIDPFEEKQRTFDAIQRRDVFFSPSSPLHREGSVVLAIEPEHLLQEDFFEAIGCKRKLLQLEKTIDTVDALLLRTRPRDEASIRVLQQIAKAGIGLLCPEPFPGAMRLSSLEEATERDAVWITSQETDWERLRSIQPAMILFQPSRSPLHETRKFVDFLKGVSKAPLVVALSYDGSVKDVPIQAGSEFGALLADRLIEGVCLLSSQSMPENRFLSFMLLQSARMRTTKTDFISCPGCGRTLFDLQEVSRRIRDKTAHLPGVKIAIMGCIVNGPGEMADADFGYVGSKPGKIDLYVGKSCVERDIDFAEAEKRLIALIQSHGKWVDPQPSVN